MAYRYRHFDECIYLTNGSCINENHLADQNSFGACYSRNMFDFFRQLNKHNLNITQFSLLCAIKFFTNDRPLLIERDKITQIQSRYMQLFEKSLKMSNDLLFSANSNLNIEKDRLKSKKMNHKLSNVLLSFINLRALDVLSNYTIFII